MADDHADDDPTGRTTAPMSEFETREALIGVAVMVIGVVVAFGIPLLGFGL